MNWLVYRIVSGQAFFSGIILLVFAALATTVSAPILNRVSVFIFFVGAIAVAVSSTAIPYWVYGVATVFTLAWLASQSRKVRWRCTAYATVAVWLLAAVMEIPFHRTPSLSPVASPGLAVIGDSLTAGVGGDERSETWPSILSRQYQLQVQDISHMGETAASALKRAKLLSITAPVVIVEIGGNDLLGSTTAAQFAADLEALLAYLAAPDRQIVMFELPLPPFCHEFGRIQRIVAATHNVILIPRRVLLSVIAGGNATLDSIHLSQSGHQFMADCVWNLVKSAFAKPNQSL